jgi:ribosome biogenesis protein BRX1
MAKKRASAAAANTKLRPATPVAAATPNGVSNSGGVAKPAATSARPLPAGPARNKTKVLVATTRGVTTRFRHFLEDLLRLLPHAKKEPKLDSKDRLEVAAEVAELRGCSTTLVLEARKHKDLYLWAAAAPAGPTIKFHAANVHTMSELAFPGNNLLYSRPLLTFDPAFDDAPHLRLAREILTQMFAAPAGHRRTKPFVDHVVAFYVVDQRIWLRHYQIVDAALDDRTADEDVESAVVEIGPRLVLTPIKVFAGAFAGATIWENEGYISPNEIRRAMKKRANAKALGRASQHAKRQRHIAMNKPAPDPLAGVFRAAAS